MFTFSVSWSSIPITAIKDQFVCVCSVLDFIYGCLIKYTVSHCEQCFIPPQRLTPTLKYKVSIMSQVVVAYTFNLSIREAKTGWSFWVCGQPGLKELVPVQPGLLYRENPVLKTQNKQIYYAKAQENNLHFFLQKRKEKEELFLEYLFMPFQV